MNDSKQELLNKEHYDFSDLMRIMSCLTAPDGCPWDKAQTHESIRINMLEEAYEAVDAIDKRDIAGMREELGDVLLQVVFHCDMARREGSFTLSDVIDELCRKLVFRHTHIFGENKAQNSEEALGFWEKAKAVEKKASTLSEQLDRLPDSFPALLKGQKIFKKTVKAGAELSCDDIEKKLSQILSDRSAGGRLKALEYSLLLATLAGVDAEAELSRELELFTQRIKKLDEQGRLSEAEKALE